MIVVIDMKKYLKIIGVAVFIGGILAFFFYRDINKEVRAITKKEESLYLFQVGVFKDSKNAQDFAATFESSLVYQDGEFYRVIVGIAYHSEVKAKLMAFYDTKEVDYYLKEKRVNKSFLEKLDNFEKILLKSDKEEIIYNVNNSILKLFESYI